ncbi:MAG: TonB-dependent receptor domain-containing protein [Bryobacteraceae bacterium]
MKTQFGFSLQPYSLARRASAVTSTRVQALLARSCKPATLIGLAVALLASPAARAQVTSGDLVGIVVDPSGGAVPGAQVEVVEESTGVRATQTTEANGQYRFSNLHIGKYDLVVNAPGFTRTNLKGVAVELNKTATQNVTLAVGQLSQSVEVVEATETIDTSTAQIQTNFSSKLAADLPVAGLVAGGVLNLSLLGAGVTNAGGVGIGEGPSVGGQRPYNNNFTIEGIDNNEKSTTGALIYVPNDAVSEFTLMQNQFSAEFGHSSGGQFNTNIKSGTNQIHGAIYDYISNRNFNAVDQSAANSGVLTNPRFDQNRLGASVGGPIKKDKLFYYALFEYNPTGQAAVPSSPLLSPTAAGYAQLSAIPGISATNLGILQKYVAPAAAPSTTIQVGPPGGATLNVPVGVLQVVAPNYQNAYYGVASIDYNISDRDQLRGRFLYNKVDTIDIAGTLPAFFNLQPSRLYMATLSEFHNFTPSVTNELRLGYMRFNQQYPVPDLSFPGLDSFPNLAFNDLNGLPIGPDPNAPQFTIQNTYQVTDNLSWTKGAHTFKFGFDGRKYISPSTFTQRSRGDYEYSTLSMYLFDHLPDQVAARSLGNPVYYSDQISTYLYGNDQWKVNPHLTLNLGIRWEFTSVPYSTRLQPLNSISNVPGLIEFNEPKPQYKNFAPRVGIAYSPGSSGKTSIRAGFGINYDVIYDNIGILNLPPQLSTTVDLLAFNPNNIGANFLANGGILPSTSTGPLTQAEARAATAAFVENQKLPYSIQWNFGIEHQFAHDYTFEARYLGTRGVHLDVQQRINFGSPVTPTTSLPTFFSSPTTSQLAGLTRTFGDFPPVGQLPAYAAAGFGATIVDNAPIGNSSYHGLALQLNRRFSRGLQLIGAYTWSHNIDDSTADFFTTVLTPRRPQDFQDLTRERASSALDRRHRFTLTAIYDVPFFKGDHNWFMRNLVGNWEVAPIYTYESPEYATVQSAIDSNLNGDPWPDRAIINPSGLGATGTDVHAIDATGANIPMNVTDADGNPATNPAIAAYVANNPTAKYVIAGPGAFPNGGRNTLPLRPTNNLDLSLVKRFSITERVKLEFQGQFSNALNHPQYTGGYVNHVDGGNPNLVTLVSSSSVRNMLTPGNPIFNRPDLAFSSNPRQIILVGKLTF